jgi:glycogen(starch) synthase
MDVSIVITTCNRAESLRATLHALRWQTYRRFEVIVVQNPCDDHTSEVLEQFAGQIRLVQCPERNASLARNLGIAQAAGQIIGFLDDDSIPDPLWLADIVAGYDSPTIGGVGGLVLGHTGRNIHTEYCVVNRRGVPRQDLRPPLWAYQQPGCDEYVHLLGANSSYRRSALLEVGGLDEEMKIHLDETILCLRLVDRGYRVRILPRAVVAHRYMPGHLRGADRIILRPYQVVKNTFYYALQHARPHDRMPEVLRDCMRVLERMVRIGEEQFALGRSTPSNTPTIAPRSTGPSAMGWSVAWPPASPSRWSARRSPRYTSTRRSRPRPAASPSAYSPPMPTSRSRRRGTPNCGPWPRRGTKSTPSSAPPTRRART